MPSASLRAGITAVTRATAYRRYMAATVVALHGTAQEARRGRRSDRARWARANAAIAVETMPYRDQNSTSAGFW